MASAYSKIEACSFGFLLYLYSTKNKYLHNNHYNRQIVITRKIILHYLVLCIA